MAGRIARGISGLVGLGQEAYQHNKEKKAGAAAAARDTSSGQVQGEYPQYQDPGLAPPPAGLPSYSHVDSEKGETDISISSDEDTDDEDLWIEDDAQNTIAPPPQPEKEKTHNAEKWVENFIARNPPPPPQPIQLPAPVVIPQRRPGTRTRGFVKAYAPALAASGIPQDAWLEIMDGFHETTDQQGYFNVTNIAVALSVLSYTVSVGPSIIVHLSALAVHTSIEAGRRAYISKKTNSYLDELNRSYFQPRGLYALVMQYDPSDQTSSRVLDFDSLSATAISKKTGDDDQKSSSTISSFKASSGKTLEAQLPSVCPLVFPSLEAASADQQANAFTRAVGFARDYYDRREQATFAAHHPGSKLSVEQQKPFAGRYADPTRLEHSGPIGVLTGGAIDPKRRRRERRLRMREESGRQGGHIRGRRSGGGGGRQQRRQGLIGTARQGVRKVFQERVLYLMVVNMPTREEMEVAAEMEARMKAEQPNWFEKFQQSRAR